MAGPDWHRSWGQWQSPDTLQSVTHRFYTPKECAETWTRPHITLFSSQPRSPNVSSDTSEPSWGWTFWAWCWDMWGFCYSPSLVGLNGKALSPATENEWCQHWWDFPWIAITHHSSYQKKKKKKQRYWALLPNRGVQNALLLECVSQHGTVTDGLQWTLHKSITRHDPDSHVWEEWRRCEGLRLWCTLRGQLHRD